jgi:hypothetical protein
MDITGWKRQEAAEDCIMRSFITCTLHQINGDEIGGHVAHTGDMKHAYKILVRRPRRREDTIRIHLRETWWKSVDWIHLAQDREQWRALVKTVMN